MCNLSIVRDDNVSIDDAWSVLSISAAWNQTIRIQVMLLSLNSCFALTALTCYKGWYPVARLDGKEYVQREYPLFKAMD